MVFHLKFPAFFLGLLLVSVASFSVALGDSISQQRDTNNANLEIIDLTFDSEFNSPRILVSDKIKDLYDKLPVGAWAAIAAVAVVLLIACSFCCFYYCDIWCSKSEGRALSLSDINMVNRYRKARDKNLPFSVPFHESGAGVTALVSDLNARPSPGLKSRITKPTSESNTPSGFFNPESTNEPPGNITLYKSGNVGAGALSVSADALPNDVSQYEKLEMGINKSQKPRGNSFSDSVVSNNSNLSKATKFKSPRNTPMATFNPMNTSPTKKPLQLEKNDTYTSAVSSGKSDEMLNQLENENSEWKPANANRHAKGLSYGRLSPEAQERVRSVRVQAEEMRLMPFVVPPMQREDEREVDPEVEAEVDEILAPTNQPPRKPMPKALRLLGVTEEEAAKPRVEPVKKRVERMAMKAGGGIYNAGFGTAAFGGEIISGFNQLREKKQKKEETESQISRAKKVNDDIPSQLTKSKKPVKENNISSAASVTSFAGSESGNSKNSRLKDKPPKPPGLPPSMVQVGIEPNVEDNTVFKLHQPPKPVGLSPSMVEINTSVAEDSAPKNNATLPVSVVEENSAPQKINKLQAFLLQSQKFDESSSQLTKSKAE